MKKSTTLDDILKRLRAIQLEVEQELDRLLAEKRKQFNYTLHRGKVVFERNIRRLHHTQRIASWRYIWNAPLRHIFSAPVVYGMIIPLSFLDVSITLYQQICFRIYKIPLVRRKDHIIIDRHHLAYLNNIQKLNCIYCGYINGLIAYAREIIARTEQFWCPIKHALCTQGTHQRSEKFVDYGDSKAWRDQLINIREDWDNNDSSM